MSWGIPCRCPASSSPLLSGQSLGSRLGPHFCLQLCSQSPELGTGGGRGAGGGLPGGLGPSVPLSSRQAALASDHPSPTLQDPHLEQGPSLLEHEAEAGPHPPPTLHRPESHPFLGSVAAGRVLTQHCSWAASHTPSSLATPNSMH